jgi:drug/metabolite transporter (DMT)-like permease
MWLSLSFLVLTLTVVQDLLHRWMMWFGFGSYELVLYGLIPTVLFGIAYVAINRIPLKKPQPKHLLLFITSGILSFFMFHWMRTAQIKSPNIGYVNIIIYSSALFTIFATSLLFKDSLDPRAIVGAVLILVGLGLLTTVNHVRT